MPRRIITYLLPLLMMAAGFSACNDKESDAAAESVAQATAAVKSFALQADEDILANLDSVFFSIDLNGRRIFNADSLPKGTDVSALKVTVSTGTVSRCFFTFPDGEGGSETVDYLASQNSEINFSRGGVTLTVTSQDGLTTVDYAVSVNVHKQNPDSLYWNQLRRRPLPTLLTSALVAQRTVEHEGSALCATVDASGNACIARAAHPDGDWTMATATLPTNADVRSLTSAGTFLWLLDAAGTIHKSADNGMSWTAEPATMTSVLGAYEGELLGTVHDAAADSWSWLLWPSGRTGSLPAADGFPVGGGTSNLISYTTEWSDQPTAVMTGGLKASGQPTAAAWAFDGSQWACISSEDESGLTPLQGMALVPYFAYKTSDTWRVDKRTCLLALGGARVGGLATRLVFISFDRGITWHKGTSSLALPDYIDPFAEADALVFATTLSAPTRGWTPMPAIKLPAGAVPAETGMLPVAGSRVSQAVTEWECPEIFLFGGMSGSLTGTPALRNTVWCGVINRLTYPPLY